MQAAMTNTHETSTHEVFLADFRATLRLQGSLILGGIPLILAAWVIAAHLLRLDAVFAARAGLLCCLPVLLMAIFWPLFSGRPGKRQIFIAAWFVIAMFFNVWWEMPQVLFMPVFREAHQHLDLEHLPYFIAWWGYTTSDLDYFHSTRYFILAEISFWVVNLLAVFGLRHLLQGREFQALVWFVVCGALQVYNVTCIFLPYGGIVEQFANIATDSPLAAAAYWVMNLMWTVAAAVATALSYALLQESRSRPA